VAEIKIFNPSGLAKPAGPYSHIAHAKTQDVVFIAGQVPADGSGAWTRWARTSSGSESVAGRSTEIISVAADATAGRPGTGC